ncbi:vitamin K epoxide reductase complex subunit 1-like protein 1 [Physella acuta]|uniref:vitamin K epoxide reductase complex subunit 1-like protein 1 n=1 Tax=Physella acuta TaxID=109671 RepID=UPI0027DE91AC|nr:vitamin K epoxide reductase complex subunit 1-like protein 1 [Physella acuta]
MAPSTSKTIIHTPLPRSSKITRNITLLLCLLGLCLSIFALYIEVLKEKNPDYVALCDISGYVSCSRALTSRYGKGFGLVEKIFSNTSILNQPNTVYGMAYYTFQATLALNPSSSAAVVQTVFSVVANLGSVYLGYILVYIIRDLCIVCVSTYIINFCMLIVILVKLKNSAVEDIRRSQKKRK